MGYEGLLHLAIGILGGALVTGAGTWMLFAQNRISREEMQDYVQGQSPWMRDRGEIHGMIRSNTEAVGRLERSVERLVDQTTKSLEQQAVLNDRFDQFLSK